MDYKIGDPILHIELRRWADVVLVAPCSANTLAKMAGGLCDNLAVRPASASSDLRATLTLSVFRPRSSARSTQACRRTCSLR